MPRIVIASITALFAGEFVNSFVPAKTKLFTAGQYLWTRTVGSTLCGEGMDTLVFYPVAFLGVWNHHLLLRVMVFNYIAKVWVLATPLTYRIVAFLKRVENEDCYDRDTNLTPFSLRATR